MTDNIQPIEMFPAGSPPLLNGSNRAKLNDIGRSTMAFNELEQAIIDKLAEPQQPQLSYIMAWGKITAVLGDGTGGVRSYDAVAYIGAPFQVSNRQPIFSPFGDSDVQVAQVDDPCLMFFGLPPDNENPGQTEIIALTERVKFDDCGAPALAGGIASVNDQAALQQAASPSQPEYSSEQRLDYAVGQVGSNGSAITVLQAANIRSYKSSDESVSNTTLQDDDALTLSLAASSIYKYKLFIFVAAAGTAEGFKAALSGTVGVTSMKAEITLFDDVSNTMVALDRVTALNSSVGGGLSIGTAFCTIEGTIETSTAGTLLLSWAQSSGIGLAATTVQRGSSMIVEKI